MAAISTLAFGDHAERNRTGMLYKDMEEADGLVTEIMNQFKDGPEYVSYQFLEIGLGLCAWFTI